MMTFNMPSASAASVPGRMGRCRSAFAARNVTRGSMTTVFMPRFMRSMTQWPKKPSEFAMRGLLPHTNMTSGMVQPSWSNRSGKCWATSAIQNEPVVAAMPATRGR